MGGGKVPSVGLVRREGVSSIDVGVVRYIAATDQVKVGDNLPSQMIALAELLRNFLQLRLNVKAPWFRQIATGSSLPTNISPPTTGILR